MSGRLIGKKELLKRLPALEERKYRLDWLIRTRQIPIVLVGRRIYFDESEIERWLNANKVEPLKNGREN